MEYGGHQVEKLVKISPFLLLLIFVLALWFTNYPGDAPISKPDTLAKVGVIKAAVDYVSGILIFVGMCTLVGVIIGVPTAPKPRRLYIAVLTIEGVLAILLVLWLYLVTSDVPVEAANLRVFNQRVLLLLIAGPIALAWDLIQLRYPKLLRRRI